MATIAELISKKNGEDAVKELRKAFFPLKPGYKAERSHVKFEILEDNHIRITLPTGTDVYGRMGSKRRQYYLEFLEEVPEGYRKRAIDAWDKILVSLGIRRRRKVWKGQRKKKKQSKDAAKGRKTSGGNPNERRSDHG